MYKFLEASQYICLFDSLHLDSRNVSELGIAMHKILVSKCFLVIEPSFQIRKPD